MRDWIRVGIASLTLLAAARASWCDGVPLDGRLVERFSGAAGRGPYFLQMRGFPTGSERVSLNGIRLYRRDDYLIDYPSGMVAVLRPIGPADTLEIEYMQGNGQPNQATAVAPTVRLFDSGGTRLEASYLYGPGGSSAGTPPVSTIGLSAESAGGAWKLSSGFLMSTHGGSFDQRSGLRLGGQDGVGHLQVTADYARAGEALQPTAASGLQRAADTRGFGVVFRPSDRFRLASNYHRDALLGGTGDAKSTLSHEFAFQAARGVALSGSDVTEEARQEGHGTAARTDSVQLDLNPTARTAFRASHKTVARTGSPRAQTDMLHLEQKLSSGSSALAELTSAIQGGTRTETGRVGLTSVLGAGLRVETTLTQRTTSSGAGSKKTEAGLETRLAAGPVRLSTRFSETHASDADHSAAAVEIASSGGGLKVGGEVGQDDAGGQTTNHVKANVDLTPFRPLHLLVGIDQIDQLPRSQNGPPVRQDVQQVGIDLVPGRALSLSAQLQSAVSATAETDTTAVAAKVRPFSFLQFDGSVRQRASAGTAAVDPDSYDAGVAFTPLKGLKLTGGYATNPEDQGKVIEATRRRVGVETGLGAILLNGGYELEDRTGGSGKESTELGLGLRISRATRLHATYRLEDLYGVTAGTHAVYGFQFTRDLGDRFNLSLEGETTQKDGSTAPGSAVYSGSARLAMKF